MRKISLIPVLLALLVTACADDPAQPGIEIDQIRITPTQATVVIGDTLELGASVLGTDGRELSGVEVTWDVADDDVASILPAGRKARLVGRTAGTVALTARAADAVAAVLVSVENPAAQVSAIFPMNVTAGSAAFELHVRGSAFVPGSQVLWNGTPRPTTRVSETELVAVIAAADVSDAGSAEIRVLNPLPGGGTSQDRQLLTILRAPVTAVTIVPTSLTVPAGGTGTLAADARDARGQEVPDAAVVWQSSDPAVATVTAAGVVQGLAAGVAVITARVEAVTAAATVTVTPAGAGVPVITAFTPDSAIARGPVEFTVLGRNFAPNAGVFVGGRGQPTEYVGASELRVTLWPEQAANSGTIELRVFNPGPGGGWSNPAPFRLLPRLTSVVITSSSTTLFPDELASMVAHARDEQGRDLPDMEFTWSSTNPQVAFVTPSGTVRAVAPGSTLIEASTSGGMKGGITVRVFALPDAELLYESHATGNPELWVTRADGEHRRRLMPGVWASDPAVTRDGSRIAFVGRDSTGNRDIYVVNRDGSGLQRLTTDPAADEQPAWSPDGARLSWRRTGAASDDIWVMNADGSGMQNLFDNFVRIGIPVGEHPTFTPAGWVTFAYGDRAFVPFTSSIFTRPIDDPFAGRQVGWLAGARDTEPAYSPAGDVIAIRRNLPNYGDRIALLDAQTGQELAMLFDIGPGQTPAWSPDGAWLSFSYADGTSTTRNLYVTQPGWNFRKRVAADAVNAVWLTR